MARQFPGVRTIVNKDGSTSHKAEVIKKRDGKIIYRESKTFPKARMAYNWKEARSSDLRDPDKLAAALNQNNADITMGALLQKCLDWYEDVSPVGRSKISNLNRLIKDERISEVFLSNVTSATLVKYGRDRKQEDNASPATFWQDFFDIKASMKMAKSVFGYQVDLACFEDAFESLEKFKLIGKSKERDRRPSLEEAGLLMDYFYQTWYNRRTWFHSSFTDMPPMPLIFLALMFSGRRVSELCRITWADLEEKHVMVRNMKDPRNKEGNDVKTFITPEFRRVIDAMPRIDERIFPYDEKNIGKHFRAGCKAQGIENLRVHDLRHETPSWLFEKHWSIDQVALVTGHKEWKTLQRYSNHDEVFEEPYDRWDEWPWIDTALQIKANERGRPIDESRLVNRPKAKLSDSERAYKSAIARRYYQEHKARILERQKKARAQKKAAQKDG